MIFGSGEDEDTRRYVRSVARAIAAGDRHLADDLEQDVLLVALEKSRPGVRMRRPWLRSLTYNTLRFARFRSAVRPRNATNLGDALAIMPGRELDPALVNSRAEISDEVESLLLALPPDHRVVVRMRAIEELPPREVARQLGIPVETVRTRYRRGLTLLRESVERKLGDDALTEWRSPAWFVGLWPRRWLWAGFGLVAAITVGALAITAVKTPQAGLGIPAPPPVEVEVASSEAISPVELEAHVAREQNAQALARVEMRLVDESNAPVPDQELALSHARGEVIIGRTDHDGALLLSDLEPGQWTAWRSGAPLSSQLLEEGDNSWALRIELQPMIDVRVSDESGHPCPGVEIHRLDEETREVRWLGLTDAGGRLRVRTPIAGSWVAARGPVGLSSRSACLDQPIVEANDGIVQLVLNEQDVLWREVCFSDDTDPESRTVITRSPKQGAATHSMIGQGVSRMSTWLPPWRRDDGAYGIATYSGLVFMALDASGEAWWESSLHLKRQPLPSILYPKPPFAVSGQLVDRNGEPIPGMRVGIVGGAGPAKARSHSFTDEDGLFRVAPCAGDEVRLMAEIGRIVKVRRPEGGLEVDLGVLKRRRTTLAVEATGASGALNVTAYSSAIRSQLPELNPSLVGATIRRSGTVGAERCELDIPSAKFGRQVLVEAGAGSGARAVFVQRPDIGARTQVLSLDLSEAYPVRLRGHFPTDRFPLRAVWFEENWGWTSPALADSTTGVISSVPLAPGRWSLKLLDRMGVSTKSPAASVSAGEEHDFGRLVPDSGRVRVALPSMGIGQLSRGGFLRVTGESGRIHAQVQLTPNEPRPLELLVEVPEGDHRVLLNLPGEDKAVGTVKIKRGTIVDAPLSSDHVFVGLSGEMLPRAKSFEPLLTLVDVDGRVVWSRPVPLRGLKMHPTNWFLVPKYEGARLVTTLSDGTHLADIAGVADIDGTQWISSNRWAGEHSAAARPPHSNR